MPTIKAPATVLPGAALDVDLDGLTPKQRARALMDGRSSDSTVKARSDGTARIAFIAPTAMGTHSLRLQTQKPTWQDVPGAVASFQVQTVTPPPVPGPTAPIAVFGFSPTTGPAPFTVQFTNLSAGEITSWAWDFGAGFGTSTQRNPTFTFPAADRWDVKLTVTGPGGTDTQADVVVVTTGVPVPPPPDPDPDPIPGPLPTGKTITLLPGANIQNALNDATADTVLFKDGDYTGNFTLPNRPSGKPLTLLAEHTDKALMRGTGNGGGRTAIPYGKSAYCDIRGLSWVNYPDIGESAIFYFGYGVSHHIRLYDIQMRGHGSSYPPQNGPHSFYFSEGSHTDILIDGYKAVARAYSPRKGTGLHGYDDSGRPPAESVRNNITLRNFDFDGYYCGILFWERATNLLVEDGVIRNCSQGYDFSGSVSGIIRRVQTVNAGGNKLGGMTQG